GAGRIPAIGARNPVGLLHWLLDDLGAAGLHSLEGVVEVPRGQEDPAVRAFGHHRMMRRSSSVTPGSTTGGARRIEVSGWPGGPTVIQRILPCALRRSAATARLTSCRAAFAATTMRRRSRSAVMG